MGRIEKTVFISYRRTNLPWALAIYQNLTTHGYDVFFDYESINSGDFEQIILGNIRARAHFLVLLTPSALERCSNPNDWLRLEIETALDEQRNIVPLFFEGFDFGSPSISKYLTGKIALLTSYNGLNVPTGYFDEAMVRLQTRFLNIPLDAVLHPVSSKVQKEVHKQQIAASNVAPVREGDLNTQEWIEKGFHFNDLERFDEAYYCFNKAILLNPNLSDAYLGRGITHAYQDNFSEALSDANESIRLNPQNASAYALRSGARLTQGDKTGSFIDVNEAIRIDKNNAAAYGIRGRIYFDEGNMDEAIKDFNRAIYLNPDNSEGYLSRGNLRIEKGDVDGAINDFTEAIRLDSKYNLEKTDAYYNRASAFVKKEDYYAAIADFQKYLDLGGGIKEGDQKEVEGFIKQLKKKIK